MGIATIKPNHDKIPDDDDDSAASTTSEMELDMNPYTKFFKLCKDPDATHKGKDKSAAILQYDMEESECKDIKQISGKMSNEMTPARVAFLMKGFEATDPVFASDPAMKENEAVLTDAHLP